MITAIQALERLADGNRRFVNGEFDADSQARRTHQPGQSGGQAPFAIILACSDSRVPVEMVFDAGFGDLFVIRVAGNIVAPSQIGSIEFAAEQFGCPLVIVLGHTHCGAVSATLDELVLKESLRSPNLRAIVDRVRPAVEPVLKAHGGRASEAALKESVRSNIRASVERLSHGSLILEKLIDAGELTIVGAEYSIETGGVEFFRESAR
ncbi:MAG: carbonic anhydrase [Woeseiaceae bacterium]